MQSIRNQMQIALYCNTIYNKCVYRNTLLIILNIMITRAKRELSSCQKDIVFNRNEKAFKFTISHNIVTQFLMLTMFFFPYESICLTNRGKLVDIRLLYEGTLKLYLMSIQQNR